MNQLSIGPAGAAKYLAGAGFTILIGLGGLLFVGGRRAASSLDRVTEPGLLFDGTTGQSDLAAAAVADLLRTMSLCGLPAIVLGAFLLARLLRRAAWLDRTRLTVRGALLSSTVDLARADVTLRRHVLVAQMPGRGPAVRLPVRGLPAYQLELVAGAIGSGPAGEDLRRRAAGPFAAGSSTDSAGSSAAM